MKVLTFVQLLVGFIVDLLNVNPEVNNDHLWIRGIFAPAQSLIETPDVDQSN